MGVRTPARLRLEIQLDTALHIGAGFGLGQLLNAITLQGPHPDAPGEPLPYLPGSSLKGRLRHHARELAPLLIADGAARQQAEADLFGFDQRPGALTFGDAHLSDLTLAAALAADRALGPLTARSQRAFVSLSRGRRVALDQRLFRIELTEAGLGFTGEIAGNLPEERARPALGLLIAAARDLTHLGGYKARGLGRCRASILAAELAGSPVEWQDLVKELR